MRVRILRKILSRTFKRISKDSQAHKSKHGFFQDIFLRITGFKRIQLLSGQEITDILYTSRPVSTDFLRIFFPRIFGLTFTLKKKHFSRIFRPNNIFQKFFFGRTFRPTKINYFQDFQTSKRGFFYEKNSHDSQANKNELFRGYFSRTFIAANMDFLKNTFSSIFRPTNRI